MHFWTTERLVIIIALIDLGLDQFLHSLQSVIRFIDFAMQ